MADRLPTITIDVKTAESLFWEVEAMRKRLNLLRKKIIELLPAKYGSDFWWEKSTRQALKEIKKGRGVEFKDIEEASKWLNT